jgi:hypothetical protein
MRTPPYFATASSRSKRRKSSAGVWALCISATAGSSSASASVLRPCPRRIVPLSAVTRACQSSRGSASAS